MVGFFSASIFHYVSVENIVLGSPFENKYNFPFKDPQEHL